MDIDELNIEEKRAAGKLIQVIVNFRNSELPKADLASVIDMYSECLDEIIKEQNKRRNKRKQS